MRGKGRHESGQSVSINEVRSEALTAAFTEATGRRVFLLTDSFPFMIIGRLAEVSSDFVLVNVETTHITELEGQLMRIHLDAIESFYIEDGGVPIPRIC